MSQKPHLIFITCDHLRADFLGCGGNRAIQTPHIDFLAQRGVRFSQAYSTTPVCIPARQIMMTGLDGHSLGKTYYDEGFEIRNRETLPELLHRAGYQTRVVGKRHLYPERYHYGFENMLICEEGRPLGKPYGENHGYDDYEIWLAEQGYPGQAWTNGIANNEINVGLWHLPDQLHPTEWIGREACKAIKARDWTRPQFLWVSFTAPHPPFTPLLRDMYLYEGVALPRPALGDWLDNQPFAHQVNLAEQLGAEKSEHQIELAYRAYFAMMSQVDRWVNLIIGTLREEGLLESTWFVFSSDHGDNMGDHHLWAKRSLLQGSCHVPLIITPPVRGDLDPVMGQDWIPGQVNHSVVGLQDIMPTILDLAGVASPPGIDGYSLRPLVHRPAGKVRDVILGEHGECRARSLMLTDGCWKYIWYEEDGTELLFQLEEDPNELHNLALKQPQMADEWRARLVAVLTGRQDDPAVAGGALASARPGRKLTGNEKARLLNDYNARGLH